MQKQESSEQEEEKRKKRLELNKKAARQSRMKKKAYIQELETKVSTLSDHVRVLLAHSQQNGLPVPEYIESYLDQQSIQPTCPPLINKEDNVSALGGEINEYQPESSSISMKDHFELIQELSERCRQLELQYAMHTGIVSRLHDMITLINMNACRVLLGYTEEEMCGKDTFMTDFSASNFKKKLSQRLLIQNQRALLKEEVLFLDCFLRKDQEQVWLEGLGQAWQAISSIEYLFVFREITQENIMARQSITCLTGIEGKPMDMSLTSAQTSVFHTNQAANPHGLLSEQYYNPVSGSKSFTNPLHVTSFHTTPTHSTSFVNSVSIASNQLSKSNDDQLQALLEASVAVNNPQVQEKAKSDFHAPAAKRQRNDLEAVESSQALSTLNDSPIHSLPFSNIMTSHAPLKPS